MAEYRRNNSDAIRKSNFKTKYGITVEDYYELHEAQNGLCAICNKEETMTCKGTKRILCVDHNHATGEIRQLLCAHCNQMIGLAKEDPEILRAAIEYLEGWM